jgi:hypothetical protein
MPFLRGTRYAVQAGRTNVGGAAWTPESLPGLLAWYDPSQNIFSDAGSTAAVLDDPVYQWAPRNAGAAAALTGVQTTLGRRPLLKQGANGKYYIQLDGSDDALRTTYTDAFARDITVAAQFRTDDGGSHDAYNCVLSKNSGTAFKGWLFGFRSTTREFGVTSPSVASIAYSSAISDATWYRGVMTVGSAASAAYTIYLNGSSAATATTTDGQHIAGDTLLIGEDFTATGGSWKGRIGHIVLCSGVLSAGDLALLDAFFQAEMPT